ncbi:MAG: methyltransferase domain-containing protein [Chloroflexi bacterium]|nr:MAG: methyltransferase domain-containing protein [Chloroflexota bacterium]
MTSLSVRDSVGSAAPREGPEMTGSAMERLTRTTVLGKSPVGAYLRLGEWIWRRVPRSITTLRPVTAYAHLMHELVRLHNDRRQYFGTFFLRNRPQLQLICDLAGLRARDDAVRIAVLGCSLGAEVYSIAWSVRSTLPSVRITVEAVDISDEVLAVAREGVYNPGVSELASEAICERMTEDEISKMFDREDGKLKVKSWIREGIAWRAGDARDPQIADVLGRQDIVVANDFLCHMQPAEAERCLRNIAGLVDSGGYLVVSGVDLDVRTKVAAALGWKPVPDAIEAIHEGDRSLRLSWPWRYWGLEPFDKKRPDSDFRYASVFQLGAAPPRAYESVEVRKSPGPR